MTRLFYLQIASAPAGYIEAVQVRSEIRYHKDKGEKLTLGEVRMESESCSVSCLLFFLLIVFYCFLYYFFKGFILRTISFFFFFFAPTKSDRKLFRLRAVYLLCHVIYFPCAPVKLAAINKMPWCRPCHQGYLKSFSNKSGIGLCCTPRLAHKIPFSAAYGFVNLAHVLDSLVCVSRY